MLPYIRIRPKHLARCLQHCGSPDVGVALDILDTGADWGWGPSRAVAMAIYALTVSEDSWRRVARLLLEVIAPLDDVEFMLAMKELNGYVKQSSALFDELLSASQLADFLYLHALAGRADWPDKQEEAVEVNTRRTSQVARRCYLNGQWSSEAMSQLNQEEALSFANIVRPSQLVSQAEHASNRIWLSANGHCGTRFLAGDLGLTNLCRMGADARLESRRKVAALCLKYEIHNTGMFRTRPFPKIESGVSFPFGAR
eukprot:1799344-Amphidinium_carterae.1